MSGIHDNIYFLESMFERFYSVGVLPSGGVTRLGYTAEEDEMHRLFSDMARAQGFAVTTDEVGNTFAAYLPDDLRPRTLIGSHLDSVVDGGRYDGVAGVMAGLVIMKTARDEGLDTPISTAAFRCEESSSFGCCTIGSGLITGAVTEQELRELESQDGELFTDIFASRGYSMTPKKICGLERYLELHIEQGKVLEGLREQVGIVSDIAAPRRFMLHLRGVAEHSGATPMGLREDSLCAAAELILAIEKIGESESGCRSVATVGICQNSPNVMNVVPGETVIGVDLRSGDEESLNRMEETLRREAKAICKNRRIGYLKENISRSSPVKLTKSVRHGLSAAAESLGLSHSYMPSGAGHDAMEFPGICDTGMVFVPCRGGVSHNRAEFTELSNILNGAAVMYEYLKGESETC